MRLDQDINFEVGGVPCVMRLDTTAMGANDSSLMTPGSFESGGFCFSSFSKLRISKRSILNAQFDMCNSI